MNLAQAVSEDAFAEERPEPLSACPSTLRTVIHHARREVPYKIRHEGPVQARKPRRDSKAPEREQAILDALAREAAGLPMRYTPLQRAAGIKDDNMFHAALSRLIRVGQVQAAGKQGSKVYSKAAA